MKSLNEVISKNSRRTDKIGKTTKGENVLTVLSFVIVFAFLSTIMMATSIYVTNKLATINQTYAFVNLLLLMNFILLFAKSVFESLNVLYFSKDLKVLFRMPIKPRDIVHAKLLNMIRSEYEMEIIMLAIPMTIYGLFTGVGALFYVYMVAVLIVLPVIPITLTSLIIAIIMRFTNSIKNKSKAMYVTIIMAVFLMGFVTMRIPVRYRFFCSKL